MSDYFGIVAEPDLTLRGKELLRLASLTHLSFTHLDETQLQHGLEGESPEPGLRIHFPEGGAAYWQELRRSDKKLGEDTLRRERQLISQVGPIRFQLQETDWQAPLEHLIERKRDQYRRTGATDSLATPWKQQLIRSLAAQTEAACGGMLSTLYAGETWVASHFGLRCGDLLHYWFPVYNSDLHRFAPGRLLLKQVLEGSTSVGLRQIDRGSGDSPAKRDFANLRHSYYRGAWFRPGLRSTACRAALSLQWRWNSFTSTRHAAST
jgi:CelD/BcsL family acetyltransferase involved in cellulose biosynthesis